MKTETFFLKGIQDLELFVHKWSPETGEVKGILQIIHGSLEHSLRYEHFAAFLSNQGFVVYAHDLRGHGQTALKNGNMLLFDEEPKGWEKTLDECFLLTERIQLEYPGLPITVFGHSMGSYLLRQYIAQYGKQISGAILSGTGYLDPLLRPGLFILNILAALGKKVRLKRSLLFHYAIYGTLNSKLKNTKTRADFISRDEAVVQKYLQDPFSTEIITIDYARELVRGVLMAADKRVFEEAPKDLPILLISGAQDPVGNMGKAPKKILDLYQKAGLHSVSLKLYPEARHEMVNELNRKEAMQDMLDWMHKNTQ